MNEWQTHINPDACLGLLIDKLCSEKKQGRGTWFLHEVLVNHEKEARDFLGNERYEKELEHYSKTLIEQTQEREQKRTGPKEEQETSN